MDDVEFKEAMGGLSSIGLTVGIAWGRCLELSVKQVAHSMTSAENLSDDELDGSFCAKQVSLMLAIVVFMVPAWMMYMNTRDGFNLLLWNETGGSILDEKQGRFKGHSCLFDCGDDEEMDDADYEEMGGLEELVDTDDDDE